MIVQDLPNNACTTIWCNRLFKDGASKSHVVGWRWKKRATTFMRTTCSFFQPIARQNYQRCAVIQQNRSVAECNKSSCMSQRYTNLCQDGVLLLNFTHLLACFWRPFQFRARLLQVSCVALQSFSGKLCPLQVHSEALSSSPALQLSLPAPYFIPPWFAQARFAKCQPFGVGKRVCCSLAYHNNCVATTSTFINKLGEHLLFLFCLVLSCLVLSCLVLAACKTECSFLYVSTLYFIFIFIFFSFFFETNIKVPPTTVTTSCLESRVLSFLSCKLSLATLVLDGRAMPANIRPLLTWELAQDDLCRAHRQLFRFIVRFHPFSSTVYPVSHLVLPFHSLLL